MGYFPAPSQGPRSSLSILLPRANVYEIVNSNIPGLRQGVCLTVLQGSIWIPIFFTKGNLF